MTTAIRLTPAERQGRDEAQMRANLASFPFEVLGRDTERGLTYRWYAASPRPDDESVRETGLETSAVLALTDAGDVVGSLRFSYTTDAFLAGRFARLLEWAEENMGWHIGYGAERDGYGDPLTPARIWRNAHRAAEVNPSSFDAAGEWKASCNLTDADAPVDPAVLEADLAALEEGHLRVRFGWWRSFAAVPFVVYADVKPAYRYTGVGRALYLHAAKRLAADGLVLRASTNQSDPAQALWNRFLADPTVPTGTVTLTNPVTGQDPKTSLTLDYR